MAERFRSLAILVFGVAIGVGTTLLVDPGAGRAQAPAPPQRPDPNVPSNMGPPPPAAPVIAPPGLPLPAPVVLPQAPLIAQGRDNKGRKNDTLPIHILKNCVAVDCYHERHPLKTDGDPDGRNVLSNMSVNGGGSVTTAQVQEVPPGHKDFITINTIAVTMPKQHALNTKPVTQQTLYVSVDAQDLNYVVAVSCPITDPAPCKPPTK